MFQVLLRESRFRFTTSDCQTSRLNSYQSRSREKEDRHKKDVRNQATGRFVRGRSYTEILERVWHLNFGR